MLEKFNYYSLLIVGFSLCLVVANIHNIIIIILVVSWGLTLFMPRRQLKWNKLFLPLASLYVLIFVGVLYSDNKDYGLFFIESFSILMVLPLVLLADKNELSRNKLLNVIISFTAGVLTLNLISLFFISYDLWDPKNLQSNLIIANNVIVKIHPTFLSMYISLSIFFLADQYFPLSRLNRTKLGWVCFSLTILIVFLIWLNSRAGILAFFMAAVFFIGFKWKERTRILGYIGLILFLFLIVVIPFSNHRFVKTPLIVLRGDTAGAINDPSVYPLVTRMQIYKSDLEMLKWPEIIYGYGTGDFRDVLQERFRANHYERPLAEHMDSHSEYFAQLHRSGIIGLGLFLALLIVPFRHAIKYKSPLMGAFIILFAITALFENVFSAQKGVTFFALFCPLLWLFAKQEYEARIASQATSEVLP
ncbi:MAG: O-antigen ligase family protein [Cyclobacteriaceae bacterium]|nr:O-antigen ligase family protein [Cyclobacteriaceae bacterium]